MPALPRYQQLADHYEHAIVSGVLTPATRMPSIRKLMSRHRVSLSTALHACRELEYRGLLEARPRSGYFVRDNGKPQTISSMPPPRLDIDAAQYVGIHAAVSAILAEGKARAPRIDLGGACGAMALYPAEALRKAVLQTVKRHPTVLCDPVTQNGSPVFRKAIAQLLLGQNVASSADEIVVTHGCTEALSLALRAVTEPGDVVAIESPTYYGLLQIIESLGLRAIEIPTDPRTGISLEALELASRLQENIRAVVVIPNLQNPVGSIMPDQNKRALYAWCEARGVALIEDDTYTALLDDDALRTAIKAWDKSGNVILCSTLHKTLAPGMRLGWIIGGKWHARIEMLKYSQSRPNEMLGQLAVASFITAGGMERHLRRLRPRLRIQRNHAAEAIMSRFPAGTRVNLPLGGSMLWVELPPDVSSRDVFSMALGHGIRIAPGFIFSNSGRFDHFMRINCGAPVSNEHDRAFSVLASIVEKLHRARRPASTTRRVIAS